MNPEAAHRAADTETFVGLPGRRSSRTWQVREHTYGVLTADPSNPLSQVSVSNSAMSIDLWSGCAWQCVYCHVQGTRDDLLDDGKMARRPVRRGTATVDEIVDALLLHPYFVPNETVLNVGAASTEPFATGEVVHSTIALLDSFARRGLRNPFWLISKAGIPEEVVRAIERVTNTGTPVVVSLSWAGHHRPHELENDRFRNVVEAQIAGAQVHWYLRPLVTEWGSTPERIDEMFEVVRERTGGRLGAIVPGGLRWTEGIEYGLKEVHALPMPELSHNDNEKTMSMELWDAVLTAARRDLVGVPVYRKSSCALSYALGRSSLTGVQDLDPEDCASSLCGDTQRSLCATHRFGSLAVGEVQSVLDQLGVPAQVRDIRHDGLILTEPPLHSFTYAVRQTVLKQLAATERMAVAEPQ